MQEIKAEQAVFLPALSELIGDADMICACGPTPMLKNIAKMVII